MIEIALTAAAIYLGILWYTHRANNQARLAYLPYYRFVHKGRKVK